MRTPDFFIVGAPRCGTSAMQDYLAQHPDIFMPRLPPTTVKGTPIKTREVHFFGSDRNMWWYPRVDEEEYRALFREAGDERRVGERSASYLSSRNAAAEIKAFAPEASIIVILRNPVDMIHSLHSSLLHNGREEIADLEAALESEADRTCGHGGSGTDVSYVNAGFFREAVSYATHLERYFEIFGRENVHVVISDDFKSATARVYRDALGFLGVDQDFEPEFRIVNAFRTARSERLKEPPRLLRRLVKPLLPKGLRQMAWRGLGRLNTRSVGRPPMEGELRRRLEERYAPEVERLSALLDRDLGSWRPNH